MAFVLSECALLVLSVGEYKCLSTEQLPETCIKLSCGSPVMGGRRDAIATSKIYYE